MSKPYKVEHIMQYTDVVYYDGEGNELDRVRLHDDLTYDTLPPVPLSDEELDEFGLGE